MALDGLLAPTRLVSINGALLPLDGWAGQFFSPMAKLLAKAPLVPALFSWRAAQNDVLQKLLDGTGSRLDATGRDLYRQLIRNPGHAGAALAMMAHWDLDALGRDLPRLAVPLVLVVGSRDTAVPPSAARDLLARLGQGDGSGSSGPASRTGAQIITLNGLGHLAHEEAPDTVATLIRAQARTPR
jgi:magnesium chelatase accessory protein